MTSRKSETLAYAFKPAGHSAPKQEREHAKPDHALAKAFEKWLDKFAKRTYYTKDDFKIDEKYARVHHAVRKLAPSIFDINSLLVSYQDHPHIGDAGLIISVLYNRSPDSVMLFDFDFETPMDLLGYKLAQGKTLINCSVAGNFMGYYASASVINFGETGFSTGCHATAPVINFGKAGEGMGGSAKGPVINFGKADGCMGFNSSALLINHGDAGTLMARDARGIVIAVKEPDSYGNLSLTKLLLKPDDCKKIPKLIEYLDKMRTALEAGRKDYRKAIAAVETLGRNPGKKIEDDINQILRRSGYDV